MKKAFSYIRMSTTEQLKGTSLERQTDLVQNYCKKMGFNLIDSLHDIGVSAHKGENLDKGELGLFIKSLEDGVIESDCVLIVENLDRLSRQNPVDSIILLKTIIDFGVEVHTISDNRVYKNLSEINDLLSTIVFFARANDESKQKSNRGKNNWEIKRKNINQKILTSKCPAWLRANKDKTSFEVIDSRAKTIQKIFDLCIEQNMGAYAISKYLNDNISYHPTFQSNKGWYKSYVTKILNNPSVYGEFTPHKKVNKDRVPTDIVINGYYPNLHLFLVIDQR